MPNLEQLCISGLGIPDSLEIGFMTELRKLDLDALHPLLPLTLPSSLQELKLRFSRREFAWDEPDFGRDLGAHNLLSLELELGSNESISLAENLVASNKPTLRRLALRMHELNSLGTIVADFGPFPSLASLSMRECELEDERMIDIADHCPRLVELDVTSNEKITGVGVKACVTRKTGTQIRSLNLTNCSGVRADAVHLASNLGVKVMYSFPNTTQGNKRARRYHF